MSMDSSKSASPVSNTSSEMVLLTFIALLKRKCLFPGESLSDRVGKKKSEMKALSCWV